MLVEGGGLLRAAGPLAPRARAGWLVVGVGVVREVVAVCAAIDVARAVVDVGERVVVGGEQAGAALVEGDAHDAL